MTDERAAEVLERTRRVISSVSPLYEAAEVAIKRLREPVIHRMDCISRQAAIDAINEYMVGKRCDTDGTMMASLINELVIKKLPSAQPEIIQCKDCKYADYMDDVKTFWCSEGGRGKTVAPDDFCSYAERREDG